eukprot:3770210-Ditylum_brightwellii.AAC.1
MAVISYPAALGVVFIRIVADEFRMMNGILMEETAGGGFILCSGDGGANGVLRAEIGDSHLFSSCVTFLLEESGGSSLHSVASLTYSVSGGMIWMLD